MSIRMVKNIKEERLRWILPVVERKMTLTQVALLCPHSKRSLERWVSLYQSGGVEALVPKSTVPHMEPNETPIWLKERVIALRKETRLCALKLHWRLKKEGIVIASRTIGKILQKEGLVRKYRIKKVKYKYLRAQRLPGDLIEIDVKHVPGPVLEKKYYQYTAIDVASRWRYLHIFDAESNDHSVKFLKLVLKHFPHAVKAIKTDNHATFTNYYTSTTKRSDGIPKSLHALDQACAKRKIVHYLIDPGKPAQNGTVERSHREDEEKFYQRNHFRSFDDLKKKVRDWNQYYNDLEHCGLKGKTPNEFLQEFLIKSPPNVRA